MNKKIIYYEIVTKKNYEWFWRTHSDAVFPSIKIAETYLHTLKRSNGWLEKIRAVKSMKGKHIVRNKSYR